MSNSTHIARNDRSEEQLIKDVVRRRPLFSAFSVLVGTGAVALSALPSQAQARSALDDMAWAPQQHARLTQEADHHCCRHDVHGRFGSSDGSRHGSNGSNDRIARRSQVRHHRACEGDVWRHGCSGHVVERCNGRSEHRCGERCSVECWYQQRDGQHEATEQCLEVRLVWSERGSICQRRRYRFNRFGWQLVC